MHYLLAMMFFVNVESDNTRKVTIVFDGKGVVYDAYLLQWGDGKEAFQTSDKMPQEWVRTHTYEQNGSYVITLMLRRGERTFKAFSKIVNVRAVAEGSKEASP